MAADAFHSRTVAYGRRLEQAGSHLVTYVLTCFRQYNPLPLLFAYLVCLRAMREGPHTTASGLRHVSPWGHLRTDKPLYCVLTRVRLRSICSLLSMLLMFHKVRREAQQIPHLKRAVFLIEDLRTFFILSIWDREEALLTFGTLVGSHVEATRKATSKASTRDRAMEIWSTEWRICAVSNNLNWGDQHDWSYLWPHDAWSADNLEGRPSGTHEYRD